MAERGRRIVMLGKTGAGKSSLANTLCGGKQFAVCSKASSGTVHCQTESTSVEGRYVIITDTPGFFDTKRPEEEIKQEIVRCITECAPGPHAFLIILKVEKYTEQEKAVVEKITQYFSEEALRFTVVVFTHGDQLEEMSIQEFVSGNEDLKHLLEKCQGRYHVVDNKYWKSQDDEERSNHVQIQKLLDTIDNIIGVNNGACYTNEMLQAVGREIKKEEEKLSPGESPQKAKDAVSRKLLGGTLSLRSDSVMKIFLSGAMVGLRKEEPYLALGLGLMLGALGGKGGESEESLD